MDKPSFVYTTFIRSTPERLWQALTEPAFTERYWGMAFETDWKTGSTMILHQQGVTVVDPEQVVLEADPYRRLSYTWHTFTPEWAEACGVSEQERARIAAEPRSKVTFQIEEEDGDLVRLTVVHDGFEPGSRVVEMIGGGWPRVLSALKTFLETGDVSRPASRASRTPAAS